MKKTKTSILILILIILYGCSNKEKEEIKIPYANEKTFEKLAKKDPDTISCETSVENYEKTEYLPERTMTNVICKNLKMDELDEAFYLVSLKNDKMAKQVYDGTVKSAEDANIRTDYLYNDKDIQIVSIIGEDLFEYRIRNKNTIIEINVKNHKRSIVENEILPNLGFVIPEKVE